MKVPAQSLFWFYFEEYPSPILHSVPKSKTLVSFIHPYYHTEVFK